jgi:hypothetical protein
MSGYALTIGIDDDSGSELTREPELLHHPKSLAILVGLQGSIE